MGAWGASAHLSYEDLEYLLKVKVFIWLILKKKISKIANLQKKEWMRNIVYVLYGVEAETVNHLFMLCVVSRFVIAMALEEVQSRDFWDNVRSVWDKWNSAPSSRTRLTDSSACYWVIWDARNNIIFQKANGLTLIN